MTTSLGACVDSAGTAVWQIGKRHGDVVGTVDGASNYTANPAADEFGVGTTPSSRLSYLGGYERFTADSGLGLIRMGVRLYDPILGRFLQADPVRGGAANAYDYSFQDPVNGLDQAGDISFCSSDFCPAAIAQNPGQRLELALSARAVRHLVHSQPEPAAKQHHRQGGRPHRTRIGQA